MGMNSEAPAVLLECRTASDEWTSGVCPNVAEQLCSAQDPCFAGKSEAVDALRPGSATLCGNRGPFCASRNAPAAAKDARSTGQSVLLATRRRICGADCWKISAALLQSPVPF